MQRSPPRHSELKDLYSKSHVSQFDLLLYHISTTKPFDEFHTVIFMLSGSRGNGIQPPKKASTWEKRLSLYKKSLQNTISSSHSSVFFRTPGQSRQFLQGAGELRGYPRPAPGVFTFSCVSLQRQGAALAQCSGSWFLCTSTRATISLGAAKAPCVCPSTWGSLVSSPKLAASKT